MMLQSSLSVLWSFLIFVALLPAAVVGQDAIYRINTFGNGFTDQQGRVWEADNYFTVPGLTYSNVVQILGTNQDGTTDAQLYYGERYKDDIQYDLPVGDGCYTVVLHWAEVYQGTVNEGDRVFDVIIEGVVVRENFDIVKEAGAAYTAVAVQFTDICVTDGDLTLTFGKKFENPKINGIEVYEGSGQPTPTQAPPPTPAPVQPTNAPPPGDNVDIYINTGSSNSVTDEDGNTWVGDIYFSDASRTYQSGATIVDAPLGRDDLYLSERYEVNDSEDKLAYTIPVPSEGTYVVTCHFAEVYFGTASARQFSLTVQGIVVQSVIDIFAEVGANKPLTKVSPAFEVSAGESISIVLMSLTQNAKISAIEVHKTGGGQPTPTAPPPTPAPVPTNFTPIRINCGAGQVVTTGGVIWEADRGFNSGTSVYPTEADISGVIDSTYKPLYQTERYDLRGGTNMTYTFDSSEIPSGSYFVTLHLCEIYVGGVGQRVFDVVIQGAVILSEYDIIDETGGPFVATTETTEVFVSTGEDLVIEFFSRTNNAKISAIEIEANAINPTATPPPTTPPPTTPPPTTKPPTTPPPTTKPPTTPPPVGPPGSFEPIYINVGSDGETITDGIGRQWIPDTDYTQGKVFTVTRDIGNIPNDDTLLEPIYQSERYADSSVGETTIAYEILVDFDGTFKVTFLFAEIYNQVANGIVREFNVSLEGETVIENLNIFEEAGGIDIAYNVERTVEVTDRFLSIELQSVEENCKLNGIAIELQSGGSPHYAHAVPGGPYFDIANEGQNTGFIDVDGKDSHTHRPGAILVRWTWKVQGQVVGEGESTTLELPIGEHVLTLEVEDSGGDVASDFTQAVIRPSGFPEIFTITPDVGDIDGGETLTISGQFLSTVNTVTIAGVVVTEITIINDNEIEVLTPTVGQPSIVDVFAASNLGESNRVEFEYINFDLPAPAWDSGVLVDVLGPTTLVFGPDGRLYIGTQLGSVVRLTLDDNLNVLETLESSAVQDSEPSYRVILGIAIDPDDTKANPDVYVSHSSLFHEQDVSYNGKVSKLSGPNLDVFTNVVTGIPISDHDHGVNGMEWGNDGELYICNGGNTNAGVPGALTSREQQNEDWYSAAILVARGVNSPGFVGDITYDGDGNPNDSSIDVFTPGMRNPFDLVLHSNGKLYGTDNGPNNNFGNESVACNVNASDPSEPDELNLLVQGNYYGHPNRFRGAVEDQRQCKYYAPQDAAEAHTQPIAKLPSSSNGICEYDARWFGQQLWHQLIVGKWRGDLRNCKLSPNGASTVSGLGSFPPQLLSQGGLDVTLGPDGTLFVAGNGAGIQKIFYHRPVETVPPPGLMIMSVFPRRGPKSGGSTMSIYCQNLDASAGVSVTVGGNECTNPVASGQKITCKIPEGAGKVDVVVTTGVNAVDAYEGAFRYTNTQPGITPPPPPPTPSPPPPPPTPSPPPPPPPTQAPPPTPTSFGVTSFVFVDTITDNDIGDVSSCNGCFAANQEVNIRAEVFGGGSIGSVGFELSPPGGVSVPWSNSFNSRTENAAPYALFGDNNGNYGGYVMPEGTYRLVATAYSGPNRSGNGGGSFELDFTVSHSRRRSFLRLR